MRRISKIRALQVSLVAIASVILLEGAAGIITGSLALLSDAGHAAFDALSTLILLVATHLALQPADEDHMYGHGKIESLGALVGGIASSFGDRYCRLSYTSDRCRRSSNSEPVRVRRRQLHDGY